MPPASSWSVRVPLEWGIAAPEGLVADSRKPDVAFRPQTVSAGLVPSGFRLT